MRYLVVDDSVAVRRIFERTLAARGHCVRAVASGREAIDALAKGGAANFDLVLLDYSMPDLDGVQTFESIRKVAPDLPAIMVTAHGSTGLAVTFMRLGGDMFVTKPVDFDLLEVIAHDVVEKAALRRAAHVAHTAALKREAELSAILEASPGAIIVFNGAGAIRQFNPAAQRLFGPCGGGPCSARALVDGGLPMFASGCGGGCAANIETLVPGLLATADVARAVHGHRQGAVPPPIEMEGHHGSGQSIALEISVSLLHNDPEPLFIAIGQDITERVLAREALRVSEARLRALLENATAAVSLKDAQHRYVLVNPAWEILFGRRAAEAIGKTVFDLFPEEVAAGFHENDRHAFDGQHQATDLALPAVEGVSPRCALSLKFPVVDDTGIVIGTGGITTDITKRKKAEQQLADSEAKFRAIVEGESLIGMSILDFDADDLPRIHYASPRLAEILGHTGEDLANGRFFLDLVLAEDRAQTEASIHRALTGAPELGTFRVRLPDGSAARIEARHARARYAGRDVVVGVLRSMTVEEEAAARAQSAEAARIAAEDASRAKSAFLANISHELRTPLTAILGFAEVAERRLADGQVALAGQHLQRIVNNAERLAEVINTVLDLSKIESRRDVFRFLPHNVHTLVLEAAADLQSLAQSRGLRIRVDNDAPAGRLLVCERQHVSRLIVNLLSNAIKFANPDSEITVAIRDGGPTVNVSVQNFGIPIPREDLIRIFEPFTQSSSTDDGSGGTGLGLALCRQIVALHEGDIHASSTDKRGVVFSFSLPWSGPSQTTIPQLESVA